MSINREERLEAIRSRAAPFDIVVIGGGATGAGCALDAASRGLSVLLLEQSDFGKGTSSRSTKLIHGGVRYLEQGNISLVREALAERSLLAALAPDFVSEQAFVVPCYGRFDRMYYGAGLRIYDLMAGKHSLGKTKSLSRNAAASSLPGLRRDGLRGGVRYLDARFDDSRFLVAVLAAAESEGASVVNYARVEDVANGTSGIKRVAFQDVETGERFETEARAVINAAGIFSDEVEGLAAEETPSRIAFSQGIHLVFDAEFLPGEDALMIPKTSDGRVLFAIPWTGKLLVGTTDTPVGGPALEPVPLEQEIDFIISTCSAYFTAPPGRGDIRSVFAGIRPLISDSEAKKTSRISREHIVEISPSGMVTVRGGKWTTFRRMAKDAVDAAVTDAHLTAGKCRTDEIEIPDKAKERARAMIGVDPTLGEPLAKGFPYTHANVKAAVVHSHARKVEDVLARRTRLLFLDADVASEAAGRVAELMAPELGWSGERVEKEVQEFRELARSYLPRSV